MDLSTWTEMLQKSLVTNFHLFMTYLPNVLGHCYCWVSGLFWANSLLPD